MLDLLYWTVIGIFIIAVLIGIKDWINFVINSFTENGVKFTLLLVLFFVLLLSPSFIKDYAPDYYGYSIWALILYSVALIFMRFNSKKNNHDVEG